MASRRREGPRVPSRLGPLLSAPTCERQPARLPQAAMPPEQSQATPQRPSTAFEWLGPERGERRRRQEPILSETPVAGETQGDSYPWEARRLWDRRHLRPYSTRPTWSEDAPPELEWRNPAEDQNPPDGRTPPSQSGTP